MRLILAGKVLDKQSKYKSRIKESRNKRKFTIGEQVVVQNFRGELKWLDDTVTMQTILSSRRRSTPKAPR